MFFFHQLEIFSQLTFPAALVGGLGKSLSRDAEVPLNMQRLKLALRSNRGNFFWGKRWETQGFQAGLLAHGFIDICDAKEKKVRVDIFDVSLNMCL